MSLEQVDQVDAIGIENDTQEAILTIADSWDWTDEEAHLAGLQAKLNAYFGFIESGQVWGSYPAAKEKTLRIDVVFRFAPTIRAIDLLTQVAEIAAQLNVKVTHYTFGGSED